MTLEEWKRRMRLAELQFKRAEPNARMHFFERVMQLIGTRIVESSR
jgi:hypothetical protein